MYMIYDSMRLLHLSFNRCYVNLNMFDNPRFSNTSNHFLESNLFVPQTGFDILGAVKQLFFLIVIEDWQFSLISDGTIKGIKLLLEAPHALSTLMCRIMVPKRGRKLED